MELKVMLNLSRGAFVRMKLTLRVEVRLSLQSAMMDEVEKVQYSPQRVASVNVRESCCSTVKGVL